MADKEVLLSVVVPVFNEALTIGNVIGRLRIVLQDLDIPYEIIVADDCSWDDSAKIALSENVRVYSLKTHEGKGYAMRMGFSKAKGEIIATIDSDASNNPEELPRLLTPVLQDQADLVIGSRFMENKQTSTKALHKAGVRIFDFLIELFTGIQVSDSQSGFRVLKSRVLENLNLKATGYEIESEMLVRIIKKGFRVKEVPVSFQQRTYGRSQLDPIKDGFKIFLSIMLAYSKG
jgi:glycosyltransferase involved in cell wall biosynthesis